VDDFVEPEIRIGTLPESIAAGESYQLDVDFFNDVGQNINSDLRFISSNENVLTVADDGVISALSQGNANVTITSVFKEVTYTNTANINVSTTTVISEPETKSGTIKTTSSYQLQGTFSLESTETGILIRINDDYIASESLPGLYIYLTNNPNTNNGAYEIGKVDIYEGEHTYTIEGSHIDDFSHILYYCKPFGVKVGDGPME